MDSFDLLETAVAFEGFPVVGEASAGDRVGQVGGQVGQGFEDVGVFEDFSARQFQVINDADLVAVKQNVDIQ